MRAATMVDMTVEMMAARMVVMKVVLKGYQKAALMADSLVN
jgi:hypothetical protein